MKELPVAGVAASALSRASSRTWVLAFLLPILLVAAAAVRLYRSPWSASHLHVVPDAVEYAVCAERFVTLGHYDLEIEGVAWPPQCSPWFSIFVLSPAYFLAPQELGAGILPVLLISLVGVLAAFAIGRRLSGDWGGAAAVVVLVASDVYRPWSREIMTDAPAAAIGLCGCLCFLRMQDPARRTREWTIAGLLTAAAVAMRGEYVTMLLPFAWIAIRHKRRVVSRLCALILPWSAVAVATALYNASTFGDWRRSGYQLWTPVPWDYPSMMFAARNVPANIENLFGPWALPGLVIGTLGTVSLLALRSKEVRPTLAYVALAAGPGSIAHLFFFHVDIRFQIFALSMLCVLGGAGLAALVPLWIRRAAWFVPVSLAPLAMVLSRQPDPTPTRRMAADALARWTPTDAVIVSGIDPVYLEPLVLRGTTRRVVPVSRDVEYASKCVASKRIPEVVAQPKGPTDHRAPGLFRGGARDVCEFTSDEKPERLAEWVRQGVPVYVDGSFLPEKFPLQRTRELGLELQKDPAHPWLGRLVLNE